jgi:hypothetical protein
LIHTPENAIADRLSLSLSKSQEYEETFAGLRKPWMAVHGPQNGKWDESMTEIMRDETRCLGRFYFTSLLEYIRERQMSMKDISGLESIEKTVRQWQTIRCKRAVRAAAAVERGAHRSAIAGAPVLDRCRV